jgi:hypothetical protein
MSDLEDIIYSHETTIAAVRDDHQYLTNFCLDEDKIFLNNQSTLCQ